MFIVITGYIWLWSCDGHFQAETSLWGKVMSQLREIASLWLLQTYDHKCRDEKSLRCDATINWSDVTFLKWLAHDQRHSKKNLIHFVKNIDNCLKIESKISFKGSIHWNNYWIDQMAITFLKTNINNIWKLYHIWSNEA